MTSAAREITSKQSRCICNSPLFAAAPSIKRVILEKRSKYERYVRPKLGSTFDHSIFQSDSKLEYLRFC